MSMENYVNVHKYVNGEGELGGDQLTEVHLENGR